MLCVCLTRERRGRNFMVTEDAGRRIERAHHPATTELLPVSIHQRMWGRTGRGTQDAPFCRTTSRVNLLRSWRSRHTKHLGCGVTQWPVRQASICERRWAPAPPTFQAIDGPHQTGQTVWVKTDCMAIVISTLDAQARLLRSFQDALQRLQAAGVRLPPGSDAGARSMRYRG